MKTVVWIAVLSLMPLMPLPLLAQKETLGQTDPQPVPQPVPPTDADEVARDDTAPPPPLPAELCADCWPGDVCSRAGHCIPPLPMLPPASAPVGYPQTYAAGRATSSPAYDLDGPAMYEKFSSMKSSGGTLLTLGLLFLTGATVMAVIGALDGGSAVMVAAGLSELLGVGLLIPGIVMMTRGGRGMNQYRQYASVGADRLRLVASPAGFNLRF